MNQIQNFIEKCGKCILVIMVVVIGIYFLNKSEGFVSPLPNGIPDGEYPCNANKDLFLLRNKYGPVLNNSNGVPDGRTDSSLCSYNYSCDSPMFYPAMVEEMSKSNNSLFLN